MLENYEAFFPDCVYSPKWQAFQMQCKQAAVRVSPKTWEEIEERMLLTPNN
ncbi:MAG: hypothetical protein AB1861_06750 [Cyanobacteriota bacterium]